MRPCPAPTWGPCLLVLAATALGHPAPDASCGAALPGASLPGCGAPTDVVLLQREASKGRNSGRPAPRRAPKPADRLLPTTASTVSQTDWRRWGSASVGAPELLQVQAAVGSEPAPDTQNDTESALFSTACTTAVSQYVQWRGDIFADAEHLTKVDGDIFARSDGLQYVDWWSFFVVVVVLFLIDFFILQKICIGGSMVRHLLILCFWFVVGAGFAVFVYYRHGTDLFWQWLSGYLLEWLLGMDNLFLFHVIFKSFATPVECLHKALFIGIAGAVSCRLVFFMLLHNLLHLHNYFRYVFGALLLYSGVKAVSEDDDDNEDPTTSRVVTLIKRCLGDRLHEDYDVPGGAVFICRNGRWCATLMLPVIFCLEVTDVLFAVDSVSAKVAQIPNQFMNYSSSVLAMFGIRALYFLLDDILRLFTLMKYGLCFILVFIGIELMISDYVKLPASCVAVMLVSVFIVCAGASMAVEIWQRRLDCNAKKSSEGESRESSEGAGSCLGR